MTATGDSTRPRRTSRRPSQSRARARSKPDDAASPPAGDEPAGTARRRGIGEKRARLNRQLVLELRALRATLTQCLDAFDLAVGGRIAETLQAIEGDDALDQRPRPLTVKVAQAALDEIAGLHVDPRKARPRDLRRIRRLVRRVTDIVSP